MNIKERYSPKTVGVNTTVALPGQSIGCFLAKTAGTITLTALNGTVLVDAHPVTAGIYVPLPFLVGLDGGTFTTAGGASGTIGV